MTSAASPSTTSRLAAPAIVGLLFSLSASLACRPRDPLPTIVRGETMGTYYSVTLAAGAVDPADVAELKAAIDGRLELVNDQMSTYRPQSELSRFNAGPGGEWFEVSPETAAVSHEALRIGELSGGAFDVTVGGLVNLWSFGAEARPKVVPAPDEIERARASLGLDKLETRLDPPALRKAHEAVYVDLSGIAKGHGVDEVAALLEERGLADYLVDIGGEMRVGGKKAPDRSWTIAIERPVESQRVIEQVLELSDVAIATSGDYRNYFEQDGKRYSHTIDPRTGYPMDHTLASVTVLADRCTTADGMATALMVLGPVDGYNFAEKYELAALLLIRDGDGFRQESTSQFKTRAGLIGEAP